MERKLTKSKDKVCCGVCGGIAEYYGIDTTILRLCTAGAALLTCVIGILIIYIIASEIMPENENL